MPRFEVTPFEPDGIPHMITISPILEQVEIGNFDELDFVPLLAPVIIDSVVERVSRYNGWDRQQCLARITGILNATNHADNKTWDKFQNLAALNEDTIFYILDKLSQSDVDVEIYNLDWTFTIDVNSLINGAGGSFPIPSWFYSFNQGLEKLDVEKLGKSKSFKEDV